MVWAFVSSEKTDRSVRIALTMIFFLCFPLWWTLKTRSLNWGYFFLEYHPCLSLCTLWDLMIVLVAPDYQEIKASFKVNDFFFFLSRVSNQIVPTAGGITTTHRCPSYAVVWIASWWTCPAAQKNLIHWMNGMNVKFLCSFVLYSRTVNKRLTAVVVVDGIRMTAFVYILPLCCDLELAKFIFVYGSRRAWFFGGSTCGDLILLHARACG